MKLRSEKKHDALLDEARYCNVAAAMIGTSIIGGVVNSRSASSAADSQVAAADRAAQTQWDIFNKQNDQGAPWRQSGEAALNTINSMQPQFTHTFDGNDLKTNLAPNYQFQLDQGLGATKNAANLQTGMLSGNTLRGINDYAQNYAGNAYQQAFNNYNAQQTNIFNRLSNIAGLGQTANQTTATAGSAAAGNIGSAQLAGGASRAAGIMGGGNAISGALNNASSWYASQNGGSGGGYGGGSFDGNTYNGGADSMGWVSGSDF